MLKALFITHDTGNYGASRSLQLLLNHLEGVRIDLVVQRPLFSSLDHDDLRRRFGRKVGHIREAFLPFDTCYLYGRKGFFFTWFIDLYNRTFARSAKKLVERIMDEGKYDLVHLNSLVLHTLISDRYPCVLHMRDIYDGSNPAAVEDVQRAAGVIFIDEATRAPFREIPLRKSIVLNNPIDMTGAAAYKGYRPQHADIDVARNTIFSVIGVVSEKKGTGFIIQTFLKHRDENSRLLIVGGRERAAIEKYRSIAKGDRRIVFWGEEPDIMKVYAMSDYILRGEEFPCVGRTVYEGLYAGCGVILPGDRDAPPPMFEFDRYRRDIHFYGPRNETELLSLFTELSGHKIDRRDLRSNVDDYTRQFHGFLLGVLGK
jgi:hypothetical protein